MFSLAIVLIAATLSHGVADTVVVHSRIPGRTLKRPGQVVDVRVATVYLRTGGGSTVEIDLDDVVAIQTDRSPDHRQADQLLAQQKYAAALKKFAAANDRERTADRAWLRREVLAGEVECRQALGDVAGAVEAFLEMLRTDPQTHYWDRAPLGWAIYRPDFRTEQALLSWLEDRRPEARLLAASWLLSTKHRAKCLEELKDLAGGRRLVGQLVAAQLWRPQLVTATAADVDRWKRVAAEMPGRLRAGPHFLIGRALARLDKHEAATVELMKPPILYPHGRLLAAESTIEVARSLEKLGRTREALSLYREVVGDYPDAPRPAAADDAARALARLKADN